MKRTVHPWRDPAFFGFVLVGVALLGAGQACHLRAARGGESAVAQLQPTVEPTAVQTSLPQTARRLLF